MLAICSGNKSRTFWRGIKPRQKDCISAFDHLAASGGAFQKVRDKKGVSIVEILVVIFILGVALMSLLGLVSFSLGINFLIKQTTQANIMAQETMEAVRNFRDNTSWDTNGLGTLTPDAVYYPQKTADVPPKWALVSGEETIGIFKRKVIFQKVYRDANDNIVSLGSEDLNTKKAIVTVSWQEKERTHQIEIITYFANWK